MLFLPYSVDVYISRSPYANVIFITATIALYFISVASYSGEEDFLFKNWILDGWSVTGLLGSMFLHGDIWHLLGNMLYLWIFGNAICSKAGNLFYIPLYLGLGAASGAAHLLFADGSAIGASGAVYGLIGFYLVLYPANKIYCFYWLLFAYGTLRISGIWLIAFWVAKDIFGVYDGGGGIAYHAHLGGFAAGFLAGLCLNLSGAVDRTESDLKTLPEILSGSRRA